MLLELGRALYHQYKEAEVGKHISFFIHGYGSTDHLVRHTRNFLSSQNTDRPFPRRDLEQHIECNGRYATIFPSYKVGKLAYQLLNPSSAYLTSLSIEDTDNNKLREAVKYEKRTITNFLTEKVVYLVLNSIDIKLKNNFRVDEGKIKGRKRKN